MARTFESFDRAGGVEPAAFAPRDRAVVRTLIVVLGLNLVSAAAKLGVGLLAGSLALLADSMHATLDASSNVVGLVGVIAGARPADRGHPYGHRRFEPIAAMVIGLLIAAGLLALVESLVRGLAGGRTPPQVTPWAVGVVAGTTLLALAVSRYESHAARRLDSSVLAADAGHTLSDALASIVVLAAFGGTALGIGWADLAATAVVCAVIGRTAWRVLAANIEVLSDSVRLDPDEVHRVATAVPGVRGAHRIRSRGASDHVHVDLHIQLAAETPLSEAHATTHEVAAAIRGEFPRVRDVVIHTEPYLDRDHDEDEPLLPGAAR